VITNDLMQLFDLIKLTHEINYSACRKLLIDEIPKRDMVGLADIAYVMREAEKFASDTTKALAEVRSRCEKFAALQYTQADGALGDTIKTDYCTATVGMKICANIPTFKKSPDAYEALMKWLGVDPMLWDKGDQLTDLGIEDTEVVRVHWPGFQCLINRLLASGFPMPEGIDANATYTQFTLRILSRKPLGLQHAPGLRLLLRLILRECDAPNTHNLPVEFVQYLRDAATYALGTIGEAVDNVDPF
jgi:hypothetical protein